MLRIDQELQMAFNPYLVPGERLIWTGRPKQGLAFRSLDVFLIPFSIVWCSFAVFWTFAVTGSAMPFPFAFIGPLFVMVGLYFVFGRFFIDMLSRAKTTYALTSKRALILKSGGRSNLVAIDLLGEKEISLKGAGSERASITFGPAPPLTNGLAIWHAGGGQTQFFKILDAQAIYQEIQKIKHK